MADKIYNLRFTLTNGEEIDAGNLVVPQGEKGEKGEAGAAGPQGEQGPQGVSVVGATLTLVE